MFRQDSELPQFVQPLPQLIVAQTGPPLQPGRVMKRFEKIARQLLMADKLPQLGKSAFKPMNLCPADRNGIDERAKQEIAFRSEPLHLALVGYPLVPQNLEHLRYDLVEFNLLLFPEKCVPKMASFIRLSIRCRSIHCGI
jgi:hypothetical protein